MDKSRPHLTSGRPADQPSIFSMFSAQRKRQAVKKDVEAVDEGFDGTHKKSFPGPSEHRDMPVSHPKTIETMIATESNVSDDEECHPKAERTNFEEKLASDDESLDNPPMLRKRSRVMVQDSSGEEFSSDAEEDDEESDDFDISSNVPILPPPLSSARSTIVSQPSKELFVPGFVRASTSVGSGVVKKAKLVEIPTTTLHELDDEIDADEGESLDAFFEYLARQKAINGIEKDVGKSASALLNRVSFHHKTGAWKVEPLTPSEIVLRSRSSTTGEKKSNSALERGLASSSSVSEDEVSYIEVRHGDLTGENVDVVVNAANSFLAHGGGVAGAMVSRGGRVVQRESDEWVKQRGEVPTGEVGVTGGGKLKADWIIHAVGPVFTAAPSKQRQLEQELFNAVYNSLKMANDPHVRAKSIAFPAISSGIFGFPKDRVARILFAAAMAFIKQTPNPSPFNNERMKGNENQSSAPRVLSQASTSTQTSPSDAPAFVRLIRFTNFDTPTVEYFTDHFELLFPSDQDQ